jgi:hypothetical protein
VIFRKWMIVAEPLDPTDPVCKSAASSWNGSYIGEKLNRYFTVTAAEMDIAQYCVLWGEYIEFKIVYRKKFEEGWR